MHLVMLETNGNQCYIFASPRLRDTIGASYLLKQLKEWVRVAYSDLPSAGVLSFDAACVSASSGKVIIRVQSKDDAEALIAAVTTHAAAQAPGLDVTGVSIPLADEAVNGENLKKIHRRAAKYAMSRPPAQARFAQMPFLVRGQDSALPASPPLKTFVPTLTDEANDDTSTALPLVSRVKRYCALHGRLDFLKHVGTRFGMSTDSLVRDLTKLRQHVDRLAAEFEGEQLQRSGDEPPLTRVAVIHIDGNGIGAVMQNLQGHYDQYAAKLDYDSFPAFVQDISASFEDAVQQATCAAYLQVAGLQFPKKAPTALTVDDVVRVVPVLLGGDDVTVMVDAQYALPFTAAFLREFERVTAEHRLLSVVNGGKFTAGAGVAIVPTKFPFHLAYHLCERLASRAKQLGKPRGLSTFAYHQLVDTTILDPAVLLSKYERLACPAFAVSHDEAAGASSPGEKEATPGDEGEQGIAPTARQAPTPWTDMVRKAALFNGIIPPEGHRVPVPFPGTRAQRMRRYAALIAAGNDTADFGLPAAGGKEGKTPSQLLVGEWVAAKGDSEADEALCEAIGGPEFIFDLINFKELLPKAYVLNECGLTQTCEEPNGE